MNDASPESQQDNAELEPAEALEELLEEILETLDLDASVEVEESDGTLTGRLEGEGLGLFIGRRGQTIDAVQHLAQRIVFPEGPSSVRDRDRRRRLPRAARRGAAGPGRRRGRGRALHGPAGGAGTRSPPSSAGSSTSTCASAATWRPTARATNPIAT